MKKTIIVLTAFFALPACKKSVSEPEVTKTAVWTITTHEDYTHPYYNDASAEVTLAIACQLENPYREVVIWDTTFKRRPMAQCMQFNPYVVTKAISGLKDSQDKITIGYSVRYISGPLHAQQYAAYGAVADIGNSTHRVNISL